MTFCCIQVAAADGETEEDTIHCATCGMQVSLKKAILHMEKCFMKVSQSVCVLKLSIMMLNVLPVGGKCFIWRCRQE